MKTVKCGTNFKTIRIFCKKINRITLFRTIIFIILALSLVLLLVFEVHLPEYEHHRNIKFHYNVKTTFQNFSQKYLIDTPSCKIPEVDPFDLETRDIVRPEKYTGCTTRNHLLTYIHQSDTIVTLNVNQSVKSLYSFFPIFCCYSVVRRFALSSKPDDYIRLSGCVYFNNMVEVSASVIFVSCRNVFWLPVYRNVHAIISPKHVEKKNKVINHETSYSVLLVGIDSVSKTNLVRTMPKTYGYLERNQGFINLKGYTKIALNTLPNLMAILSGMDLKQIKCSCSLIHNIDECYNVWRVFRNLGYITAYGEDGISIGTFNCCGKKGFQFPPTDFYFRPYMTAAELLGVVRRSNMDYCAGPETEAERIMNLAKDFTRTFRKDPTFGLFWMNTFSHDDVNMPGAMDEKVVAFLREITGLLDKTFFFFFSDHGIRFGDIRFTFSGSLEERLPFFYVHVPEVFKSRHPEEYKSIRINSGRLTTPYNFYMTLQDILVLAYKNYSFNESMACPRCHSFFKEVSVLTDCEDAAIPDEWCACNVASFVSPSEELWTSAAHFFVDEINKLVRSYPQGYKCFTYDLEQVKFAGILEETSLVLRIETNPKASFEGQFEISPQLRLVGNVSRINRYAPYSMCIEDSPLEMYCYCKENTLYGLLRKHVCKFLGC